MEINKKGSLVPECPRQWVQPQLALQHRDQLPLALSVQTSSTGKSCLNVSYMTEQLRVLVKVTFLSDILVERAEWKTVDSRVAVTLGLIRTLTLGLGAPATLADLPSLGATTPVDRTASQSWCSVGGSGPNRRRE
jgi:hypothetical protein